MQILVTGAAGFIGSHLAERLIARGHAVRGLDAFTPHYDPSRKRARLEHLAEQGAKPVRMDLARDDLAPVVRDVEGVYHLAAQPGLSAHTSREAFVRNNVRATERLLAALETHGSPRAFVYASSSSVYGTNATGPEEAPLTPASEYGRTKRQAERTIRAVAEQASWDACILRLFSVYGPRERPEKLVPTAIRCARARRPFPLHTGSESHQRSFTYVDDVVRGLVTVLDRWDDCAGETINYGRPTSSSTLRVLDLVADAVGRPLCIERTPPRDGDQRRTRARVQKARRLLGTVPTTTLSAGIAATANWRAKQSGLES